MHGGHDEQWIHVDTLPHDIPSDSVAPLKSLAFALDIRIYIHTHTHFGNGGIYSSGRNCGTVVILDETRAPRRYTRVLGFFRIRHTVRTSDYPRPAAARQMVVAPGGKASTRLLYGTYPIVIGRHERDKNEP